MTTFGGERRRSRNLVPLVVSVAVVRHHFSLICLVPIVVWMSPRGEIRAGFQFLLPALGASVVFGCLLVPRGHGLEFETS